MLVSPIDSMLQFECVIQQRGWLDSSKSGPVNGLCLVRCSFEGGGGDNVFFFVRSSMALQAY